MTDTPTLINRMRDHLIRIHNWKSPKTEFRHTGSLKPYEGVLKLIREYARESITQNLCKDCNRLLEEWEGFPV